MTDSAPRDPETAPSLLASDANRDRVAAILGQALAEGRLTSTEHAERLEAAYTARTVGELAPLTRDLPTEVPAQAGFAVEWNQVQATLSKVTRGGRWVAGRRTGLRSTFGALIVDLSEAVLPGREINLKVSAFCGKLIVRLPDNAHVIDNGGAIFSKRSVSAEAPKDPAGDGPVIRITGNARFSKVVISRAGTGWNWPWRDDG